MTDSPPTSPTSPGTAPRDDAAQAGALLRAAREKQGLRLEALAATTKVLPARLEALEAGRIDELPDATFARALAQTVCRALKTDPAPVLALMPGNRLSRLERVDEGLNTPFREHSGRLMDAQDWLPWQRPVPWLAAVLLLTAAAFLLLPRKATIDEGGVVLVSPPQELAASASLPPAAEPVVPDPAASAAAVSSPDAAAAPGQPAMAAAAATATLPASAAAAPPALPADGLSIRGLQASWVQVTDATGKVLLSRTVAQGETVVVDGALPLKLRIGNVVGTELNFRGKLVDLAPANRNNLASLTLP